MLSKLGVRGKHQISNILPWVHLFSERPNKLGYILKRRYLCMALQMCIESVLNNAVVFLR